MHSGSDTNQVVHNSYRTLYISKTIRFVGNRPQTRQNESKPSKPNIFAITFTYKVVYIVHTRCIGKYVHHYMWKIWQQGRDNYLTQVHRPLKPIRGAQ